MKEAPGSGHRTVQSTEDRAGHHSLLQYTCGQQAFLTLTAPPSAHKT